MVSFACSLKFPILITTLFSATTFIDGAIFNITNNCSYTVWAAAIPGGGRRLNQSQTWTINVPNATTNGRIWGRTGCKFDKSGQGSCQTGDCEGRLQCSNYGTPPNTLAEFALNQFNDRDFLDMSLVDGFNLPMKFNSTSDGCTMDIRCAADIIGQCPNALLVPGGCNNPCTVFGTAQYCCNSSNTTCEATTLSRYFKDRCPDVYSYPKDDPTSTFTCPGGTNYTVVFCPEPSVTKTVTSGTTTTSNTTVSECLRPHPILTTPDKITSVSPAFKVCNNQFYASLSK